MNCTTASSVYYNIQADFRDQGYSKVKSCTHADKRATAEKMSL